MRGAMERNHFSGLPGHRDDVIGGDMIHEQRIPALANRQMHSLAGPFGELLQVLFGDADQHRTPIVTVREPPQRWSENEVLTPSRIREEPSPLEGEGQPEDTAAIDSDQIRQIV